MYHNICTWYCCALFCDYKGSSYWFHVLPIFLKNCSTGTGAITAKDMGKIDQYQTITKNRTLYLLTRLFQCHWSNSERYGKLITWAHQKMIKRQQQIIARQMSSYFMGKVVTALRYSDIILGAMASHITSLTIVYSTVYSGADQRKHQSSASLAFVLEIPDEFPAQMASNAENVSI